MRIYVYRVKDSHGNVCERAVDDPAETVDVWGMKDARGEGVYFESEAWHLGGWAKKHGIEIETHAIDLRLDERSIANWVRS